MWKTDAAEVVGQSIGGDSTMGSGKRRKEVVAMREVVYNAA